MGTRCHAVLLVLVAGLPLSAEVAAQDIRVAATVEARPSPYADVRYVFAVRDGHGTFGVVKHLHGDYTAQQKIVVLDDRGLQQLRRELQACGIAALPRPQGPPPKPRTGSTARWTFDVVWGDTSRKTVVTNPRYRKNTTWQSCIDVLRRAAARHLGQPIFRDEYFPRGTFGFLQISSTPTGARVIIDGRDTGETTPITGFKLALGDHIVELVTADGSLRRRYDVKILDDITTNLDVDLR